MNTISYNYHINKFPEHHHHNKNNHKDDNKNENFINYHRMEIDGFNLYLDSNLNIYEFMAIGYEMKTWISTLCRWIDKNSIYWREKFKIKCISYLQRIMYLMTSHNMKNNTNKSDISSNDLFLSKLIYDVNILDLLELFLCKIQINMKVLYYTSYII